MLIREIMSSPAVTVSWASSVAHAAGIMRDHGFTALPVIDEDGRLVGIVSEADILDGRVPPDPRRPRPDRRPDPARRRRGDTVADVMTTPVESLTPGADAADAADIMLDEGIRCLPVVDGAAVVGVITRRDLLGALA